MHKKRGFEWGKNEGKTDSNFPLCVPFFVPEVVWATEMYGINRVHYGYLCDEAENQQLFVTFVLSFSEIKLQFTSHYMGYAK